MNKIPFVITVLCTLYFTGCTLPEKQYDISAIKPEQGIYDKVGVMGPEQYVTLRNEIQNLEKNSGSQMVIVIIDSLNGCDANQTALTLVSKLALGRKGYEDGVLILMSTKDQKISIEAGRGLGQILDAETRNRIIKDKMAYRFSLREYFQCLYIAALEINQLIADNKQLVGKFP